MRVLVVGAARQANAAIWRTLHDASLPAVALPDAPAALDHLRQTPGVTILLYCFRPACCDGCLLRQVRRLPDWPPVIVVCAAGTPRRQIQCLNTGADDFLLEPADTALLLAQLRALMRRYAALPTTQWRIGDLTFNSHTRIAQRGTKTVTLRPVEARLLEFLFRHEGEICSRQFIVERVWGRPYRRGTNLVDMNIQRLRDKLDVGFDPRLIHTVRRLGYVLKVPD
jgi:DNA-binding response OmpR family regulator